MHLAASLNTLLKSPPKSKQAPDLLNEIHPPICSYIDIIVGGGQVKGRAGSCLQTHGMWLNHKTVLHSVQALEENNTLS